jgi:hypothetical protein
MSEACPGERSYVGLLRAAGAKAARGGQLYVVQPTGVSQMKAPRLLSSACCWKGSAGGGEPGYQRGAVPGTPGIQ